MIFPALKKKLSAFVSQEDGKISKHSLLMLGAVSSSFVLAGILAAKEAGAAHANCVHKNNLSFAYDSTGLTAEHAHNYQLKNPNVNKQACDTAV